MDLSETVRGELQPPERFLRRRVRPRSRPRRGWRLAARGFLGAAGLAAVTAAGYWTAGAAGRARQLAVSRIVVEGNRRLTEGEILESLGLYRETNILSLDLPSLKKKLLGSAWVKDAELTRVLPATLTLRIVEREPAAVAVLERLYLMAEDGVLLDELGPRYQGLDLPLVRGLDDGGRLDAERAALAGRAIKALSRDQRLEAAVSELDLSPGGGTLRLSLRAPPLTLLAVEETLAERLAEFLPVAAEVEQRFPSMREVDLRFRDRIYLRFDAAREGEPTRSIEPGR